MCVCVCVCASKQQDLLALFCSSSTVSLCRRLWFTTQNCQLLTQFLDIFVLRARRTTEHRLCAAGNERKKRRRSEEETGVEE